MRELLRRLAQLEPTEFPVLSAYLDLRPQATGESPGVRSGEIILKDRLREIEKTLGPRGDALESFRTDALRIGRYMEEEIAPAAQGVALFACAGQGLFEVLETGVAFDNHVSVGALPDLFPLTRLLDEQETAVVAVVDSNTARLFVLRTGFLEEVDGPDDDSVHYRKRSMGGWSQARYQRHIDKHRADFAREAADMLDRLVDEDDVERVVLAGDEVAMTPLRAALSPRVSALIEGEPLRVHIRTPRDAIADQVRPVLEAAEAADAQSIADQLVGAVRGNGLGVAGPAATDAALTRGQVDVLVILDDPDTVDAETREALVRQAVLTGADVELVRDHAGMQTLGGVGALLRYRLEAGLAPAA